MGRVAYALFILIGFGALAPYLGSAQVPPSVDPRIYDIVEAASSERVEADIRRLAGFGTRNTLSDTLSDSRGRSEVPGVGSSRSSSRSPRVAGGAMK